MEKKVLIIGAGLAGLSAGIHLQQNGIQSEIFEISGAAGGMCTAWERGGYRFDGCIHWMVGTKPGDDFNTLYREVDALTEDTVIYSADTIEIELGGVMYEIPLRFEEFKQFLLSISTDDTKNIEGFCDAIAVFINSKMPSGAPSSLSGLITMMKDSGGFLGLAGKYMGMTVNEYIMRFQSMAIRDILRHLMPAQFSVFALFMMLGTRMSGNAGYPLGGALEVIARMQQKYLSLGGKLHLHTRVEKIVVENKKAIAVVAKGERYDGGAVIAACDAYDTLHNMLGGEYKHKQLDVLLPTAELFDPIAVVSFGLNRRFDIPFSISYECPEGIETAPGCVNTALAIRSFDFDPSAAPEGCSSVMIMVGAPLDYWQNLREKGMDEYRLKKEQLAARVAECIEKRIPGFKDAVAVTDVATPATYVRYANLYKGSWEGFAPTPKLLKTNIKTTVEGVKGLVLAGQWTTAGGGICTAISSGKNAAKAAAKAL